MTTTILAPYQKNRFVDNAGNALYLGQLTTFQAGTTTPIATYKDSTGTLNTNPIILNARGECDLWLLPNVAYKFALTDSAGNTIPGWPIDNIVNSQLITLYGGVDTGAANAYVLNFTANFTAYADGIIIYWIPSNTNSGASTINVNGLGVVNIINPDGSALSGGQIVANIPAQILFKGGSFELITPATSALNTFTPTWSGFSVNPNNSVTYRKTGNMVALSLLGNGTSNATSVQLSGLPSVIRSSILQQLVPCLGMVDGGAVVTTTGVAQISAAGVINFFKDPTLTNNWNNAGTKGFRGDGNTITLVYTL